MPAFAAEEAADDVEVIEIKGIRGSLIRAMDLKKESGGVVDAITAEDMGKFPDTNLAESLQRITGVSIDRSNGEGSQVTVRGFGPEFNMITLNGRTMPDSSVWNSSRAYDFQNLSSDAVSAVEVYKTGKANISSGGIGSTINIRTARPLDNAGFRVSVGAKALYDTSVRGGVRDYNDKVTPELSGIISWTDDAEVFGASLNASFSERHSSETGVRINSWNNFEYGGTLNREVTEEYSIEDGPGAGTYPVSSVTNRPENGERYQFPSDIAYRLWDRQRERTNAQLTLQYRPIESVTATLDYTYSHIDKQHFGSDLSGWYDSSLEKAEFTTGLNPTPAVYIENRYQNMARDVALKQMHEGFETENKSLGLNVEWNVTDQFKLVLDMHDSDSTSNPTEAYGHTLTVGLGSNVHKQIGGIYGSSGIPAMVFGFDDCDPRAPTEDGSGYNCNGQLDISEIGTTMMQTTYNDNKNEIQQIKLDGTYEFEDGGSIKFGIDSRSMSNSFVSSNTGNQEMGGWSAANAGELVGLGFLEFVDYNDSLSDYKTNGWTLGVRGDAKEIGQWASDKYNAIKQAQQAELAAADPEHEIDTSPRVRFNRNPDEAGNRTIEEDVVALYTELNLEGELGGRPYNLGMGLRFEDTSSKSIAFFSTPREVLWTSNNDFNVIPGSFANAKHRSEKNNYNHVLPSLDFSIEAMDDVMVRFSTSQTIARPTYANLDAQTAITGGPGPLPTIIEDQAIASASKNNPHLVPIESDNYDLSLEWYFDESSYASIGYFEKHVNNFIGSTPKDVTFFGLKDPSNGPRAEQALADVIAYNEANSITAPIDDTMLFNMMAANQLGVAYDPDNTTFFENNANISANDDDPLMMFRYNEPVNTNEAKLYGFELAAQHFFGETGFGIQANYTIVRGDIGFDLASNATQFALVGLSDTANLVFMYEKDDFSARLAYNWRDEFLNNANRTNGEPEFTEAYSQLDFNASYQVTDELSVSFTGINLTGEDGRKFGRNKNQFTEAYESEARYEFGARYSF
jgi:TonB-dependent receptor